jgi:hypothetical protein
MFMIRIISLDICGIGPLEKALSKPELEIGVKCSMDLREFSYGSKENLGKMTKKTTFVN